MDTMDPNTTAAIVCVALTGIGLWVVQQQSKQNTNKSVPDALGGSPMIGNALQYKENPTGCIREEEKQSKIFRLNLAGRRMVIVGSDPDVMKQVANQPESVLSSCRAVAELGFEHTLGHFNVYSGTAWHKSILKNAIMGENFATTFLPGIYKAMDAATETELKNLPNAEGKQSGPDLFDFVRRCVLRATLDEFVSPLLLQKDPDLLTALMVFQDQVEDATARAAVLPRFLALPACLWPTEKARKSIEARVCRLLPTILKSDNSNWGPWTKEYAKEKTTPELAAEHLIGLIFAAHKNPSIGAAQCFCFLRSELSSELQSKAGEEAKRLCQQFTSNSSSLTEALLQAQILRKCVLETMRVTAHTLGAVRYVNQNLEVKTRDRSYQIAKGETVSLAHHTMHMEPSLWGKDAETFSLDRPEWNENGNKESIGIPVDHYKMVTFSHGTHKCPGEKIALAMMQIQVALLLVGDTQLVGDLPPVSFERATLAQRDGPVPFNTKA